MTTDKSLRWKAMKIMWKDYVTVASRIVYFNEVYQNGCITTNIIEDNELWIIKATVTPDVSNPTRFFTGYSQALEWSTNINKTSALENAETSAVGRALAMMWIWVIESIASVDEIHKAKNTEKVIDDKRPEDHYCTKCGALNEWITLSTSKYGLYFKCKHCDWFSNPKFKWYTWEVSIDYSEQKF